MVSCGTLITDPNICAMLFNIVFPWIFSFAIIYGIALRSNVFGSADTPAARGVSGIIGIVAGFFVVMTAGPSIGAFLASLSEAVVVFLSVLVGIVLVFAVINPKLLEALSGKEGLAIAAILILIAGIIISGYSTNFAFITLSGDLLALIIILIIIGALVWFVTAAPGEKPKEQQ